MFSLFFKKNTRNIPALFIRKNESASGLRHTLLKFIDSSANMSDGEFAASRVRTYNKMQQILVENYRSSVRAHGIKAIFYSRFFTNHEMIMSRVAKVETEVPKNLNNLQEFLKDDHGPSENFKQLVDSEIEITLNMELEQLKKRDSYHEVLKKYFKDVDMVDVFIEYESKLFRDCLTSQQVKDQFNTLNRETQPFAFRLLSKDISRLEKAKRRFEALMTDPFMRIFLAILTAESVQPLIYKIYELIRSIYSA
jgi:hypothetical protein